MKKMLNNSSSKKYVKKDVKNQLIESEVFAELIDGCLILPV